MNILFLTIPMAIFLGSFFVLSFFWALRSDQFEDLETPPHRILFDEHQEKL